MNAPSDHWLAQGLARALGPELEASAGAAALADLDFEVAEAGSGRWPRRVALLIGYAALLRLFLCHANAWRPLMRRVLTVLVLGLIGCGWMFEMLRVTNSGPLHLLPFVGMLVLVPLVLRAWDGGQSYLGAMVNASIIALMMETTWIASARAGTPALPWLVVLRLTIGVLAFVLLFGAVAGAIAWKPAAGREPVIRKALRHAGTAAALFVPCYIANHLVFFQATRPIRDWQLPAFAIDMALIFAVVVLVVHLPLMRLLSRLGPRLTSPLVLAAVGALLFPVPLFLLPALQHQLPWVLQFYADNPARLLNVALPYLLAGAAVGVLTARHAPGVHAAASDARAD